MSSLCVGKPSMNSTGKPKRFAVAAGGKPWVITTETQELRKYKDILNKEGTKVEVIPLEKITENVSRKTIIYKTLLKAKELTK